MSDAEATQPMPISGQENVPVAPDNTDRTLVSQPLRNFDHTEVRWSFDILKPCGIRDRKLRHYRSQAATVLGQVYDRDPLCQYVLGRMSQEAFRTFSRTFWLAIIRAALLQGATLYEGNEFKTIAIVFPPGRCIDQGRMRRCALNSFKETSSLINQNGEKRLLDGYCRVSREMRKEALGERGGLCISALGTIHVEQAKGLTRTLITKLQAKAYDEGVPLWIEIAMPRVRDALLTLGFMIDSERRVGEGECTRDGKFIDNERLTGIRVAKPSSSSCFSTIGPGTTAGVIVIPEGSRAAGSQAERPRDDTSIVQGSAVKLSTGPMDFDDD
ncbi:hypothetical protein BJX62DRAFT_237636 [Aspergillus germanicus]